jgi:protein-disulfide isomerase
MAGRLRSVSDLVTTVAILATCGVLVAVNWSRLWPHATGPRVPATPVSLEGAAVRGNPTAPVVVVEYGDYQCPFCAAAEHGAVSEMDAAYIKPGKVEFAFRQHPLETLHPLALETAEATVCAGRQGKFWPMHASLYGDQQHLDEASLVARADRLGLDVARFKACLGGDVADQVRQDGKDAEALGLMSTPTFLIGVRQADGRVRVASVLTGARPFADFQKAIDPLLANGDESRAGERWLWLAPLGLGGVAAGVVGLRVSKRRRAHRAGRQSATA